MITKFLNRNDIGVLTKLVSDLCEETIPVEQVLFSKNKDELVEEVRIHFMKLFSCNSFLSKEHDLAGDQVIFAGLAVHILVGFISQKLKKFPIIKRTPLLQRTLTFKQPADYLMDVKGKIQIHATSIYKN